MQFSYFNRNPFDRASGGDRKSRPREEADDDKLTFRLRNRHFLKASVSLRKVTIEIRRGGKLSHEILSDVEKELMVVYFLSALKKRREK